VVCGEDPQPKDGEIDEETDPAGRALVLAVVLMAAVPVVASEARATLEASLTGEKEVPGPGDPQRPG
jgi:hypothetical protein